MQHGLCSSEHHAGNNFIQVLALDLRDFLDFGACSFRQRLVNRLDVNFLELVKIDVELRVNESDTGIQLS